MSTFKKLIFFIFLVLCQSLAFSFPAKNLKSEIEFTNYPKKSKHQDRDTIILPPFKDRLGLQITIPYINSFYTQQLYNKDGSGGFLGISGGFEYFYDYTDYFLLSAGTALDYPFFVPVPIGQTGDFEIENNVTNFVSLRKHYRDGFNTGIDYGYGIQFSRFFWQKKYYRDAGIPATPVQVESYESTGFGLSLTASIYTSDNFKFGILYQPNLYSFSPEGKFDYQHFASIEFGWRFSIWQFE